MNKEIKRKAAMTQRQKNRKAKISADIFDFLKGIQKNKKRKRVVDKFFTRTVVKFSFLAFALLHKVKNICREADIFALRISHLRVSAPLR